MLLCQKPLFQNLLQVVRKVAYGIFVPPIVMGEIKVNVRLFVSLASSVSPKESDFHGKYLSLLFSPFKNVLLPHASEGRPAILPFNPILRLILHSFLSLISFYCSFSFKFNFTIKFMDCVSQTYVLFDSCFQLLSALSPRT